MDAYEDVIKYIQGKILYCAVNAAEEPCSAGSEREGYLGLQKDYEDILKHVLRGKSEQE